MLQGPDQSTSSAFANLFLGARLNSSEQRELQGRMEKKQMKEFMTVSPLLLGTSDAQSDERLSEGIGMSESSEIHLLTNFIYRCIPDWSRDASTIA